MTKICELYGKHYIWPVRPSWLIPLFVILDVASLAVQGGGSGQAAVAEIDDQPVKTINNKGNIVVAGLAIQLAGYVAFNVLFIMFVTRARADKRRGQADWFDGRLKVFLIATYVSALLVLGRSAFRTAEMGSGWVGKIATTEWVCVRAGSAVVFAQQHHTHLCFLFFPQNSTTSSLTPHSSPWQSPS